MKSHYDTLQISPTATKDEIKKAFHQLSLKHHPDIVNNQQQGSTKSSSFSSSYTSSSKHTSSSSTELFKQISSAYTVLSNDVQRQTYDLELDEWKTFGQNKRRGGLNSSNNSSTGSGHHNRDIFGNKKHGGYSYRYHLLEGIYKPRNMVIGLTIGFVAVSTIKSILGITEQEEKMKHVNKRHLITHHHHDTDHSDKLVEAWKNPKTNRWEQPQPWSKAFQVLDPEIRLIPRKDVVRASPSPSSSSKR